MNEMREQWLDHRISDIDYIRCLEKHINALQEPKICDGCVMQNSFYLGGCATYAPCIRKATDRYKPKSSE